MWCGDPQLRPQLDGVAWLDERADDCVGRAGHRRRRRCDRGSGGGRVGATDDLSVGRRRIRSCCCGSARRPCCRRSMRSSPTTPADDARAAVVGPLADDGLAPTEPDLVADGLYSTSVAVVRRRHAQPALAVAGVEPHRRDRRRVAAAHAPRSCSAPTSCADESIGVGRWRWNCDEPALLDVDGYDSRSPWTLDPDVAGPDAGSSCSGNPQRQQAMARAARTARRASGRRCACPAGWWSTTTVRQVVADAMPPSRLPLRGATRPSSARGWRRATGRRCTMRAATCGRRSPTRAADRRRTSGDGAAARSPSTTRRCCSPRREPERAPLVVADQLRDDGLNLVGYLDARSRASATSPAACAKRSTQAGVAAQHDRIAADREPRPRRRRHRQPRRVHQLAVRRHRRPVPVPRRRLPGAVRRDPADDRLLVLGARARAAAHAPGDRAGRRDLGRVAVRHRRVRRGRRRCRCATCRSRSPNRSLPDRDRPSFAALADLGERPVFLTVFDHLSVTERKNPLGVDRGVPPGVRARARARC